MRKNKLISIFLAVLIIGTAFIMPLSANALQASESKFSITWEKGCWYATSGNSYGTNTTYFIRSNDFIDVSTYEKIGIEAPTGYEYNLHFFDASQTFIESSDAQTGYGKPPASVDIPSGTKYIKVSVYKSNVSVSDGANVTVKGIVEVDSALIDTSQKASLKVHKYEMDDISEAVIDGTGYSTDVDAVPEEAKPLQGVSFRIKRVVAIDSTGVYYYNSNGVKTTSNIYSVTGASLPTVAEAKTYKAIDNNGNSTTTQRTPIVTDANGVADFGSNLPLGIYLVEETSTPSQVVGGVADFVVSLPMTNVDGDGWKYDVEVFPKNETKYQDITIEKTDDSTGKAIKGAKFNIQYTTNGGATWSNIETDLITDDYGTVSPTNPLPIKRRYKIVETQAANGYVFDNSTTTSYDFYIDEDGNICDTTTSHNIIDPDNPHRIQMTNTKPSIEKFIDKSKGNNTELVKSSSVTRTGGDGNYDWYSIKVTTPNIDMSKIRTFTVTDVITASGGPGAPVVKNILKEDGTELSTSAYTSTKSPSYSNIGPYNLTVAFTPSSLEANTDYYIVVRTNVGKKNTTNTAKLTYSTNTTGTETTNEIESDEVNFYYFGYKLKKINGTTKAPLQNVEFKLYETLDNAEKQKNALQTVTTDTNGYAEFSYIDVGDRIENDEPVDIKEELEWETGGVNNTTGALENSDTYIRTKPVNVSLFSKIIYTGTTNIHQFYFYDKYDDFISVENADKIKTEAIITVPNNAEQMIMTYGGTGISVNSPSSWLTSLDANSIIEGSYYVVETKTNSGFSLLKEPFEIAVNNKSASVVDKYMTTVNNYNKVEFPMTGGFGFILLFTIGVMCLIFAGIVNYKKKEWGMNYEN